MFDRYNPIAEEDIADTIARRDQYLETPANRAERGEAAPMTTDAQTYAAGNFDSAPHIGRTASGIQFSLIDPMK